ncbi:MAG: hypothetical protein PF501_04895 [Salinisphaera sp.]|nr:hypothetical protein [Salinisphaera sp.]
MARNWLEVTTGEVQARMGANERLAERREHMSARAWTIIESLVAPAFQKAGEAMGRREYREAGDTEWTVARCGLYAPGSVEQDPTVAFHEAEFDAYQPLVVLRRKAAGAGARVETQTVRIEKLDAAVLESFLKE